MCVYAEPRTGRDARAGNRGMISRITAKEAPRPARSSHASGVSGPTLTGSAGGIVILSICGLISIRCDSRWALIFSIRVRLFPWPTSQRVKPLPPLTYRVGSFPPDAHPHCHLHATLTQLVNRSACTLAVYQPKSFNLNSPSSLKFRSGDGGGRSLAWLTKALLCAVIAVSGYR